MEQQIHQLRIDLERAKPPIWRRVLVPSDLTLYGLHVAIQIVMDWDEDHLHCFAQPLDRKQSAGEEIERLLARGDWDAAEEAMRGERVYSPSFDPMGEPIDMVGQDESEVSLREVCPEVGGKLRYDYDFGDDWRHPIVVEKIEAVGSQEEAAPVCVTGRKASPPEDCGGIYGYYALLEAFADPAHPQHEDSIDWLGEDFDPDCFDIDAVNAELRRWWASANR